MAKREFVKVRNIKNGGIYLLKMSKVKKEIGEWEAVLDVPEVNVTPEPESEGSLEPSYSELKSMLKALNIEFKGNASKEELMKLYEETI